MIGKFQRFMFARSAALLFNISYFIEKNMISIWIKQLDRFIVREIKRCEKNVYVCVCACARAIYIIIFEMSSFNTMKKKIIL